MNKVIADLQITKKGEPERVYLLRRDLSNYVQSVFSLWCELMAATQPSGDFRYLPGWVIDEPGRVLNAIETNQERFQGTR